MKRDPSIHIRYSAFLLVFKDICAKYNLPKNSFIKLAKEVLIASKAKSCTNRVLLANTDKAITKGIKLGAAERDKTVMFAKVLLLKRRQLKHAQIKLSTPGDKDWIHLKSLTSLALEFCESFGLTQKEGFEQYIDTLLSLLKPFHLGKAPSMHSKILSVYEAKTIIRTDLSAEVTKRMYDLYVAKSLERMGFCPPYNKNPEEYANFVKAKDLAIKAGVSVEHYINAQFAGLEWTGNIPIPSQLVSDKAQIRLAKYLAENNLKASHQKKSTSINWNKIKSHGNTSHRSQ
jgi:hypothetical protein